MVILTKNEASRIAECIRSVQWADEVLVVDDESQDDTVAIARDLGARVLQRRMDVEGRHRNWAYDQAKHEWILSLDADERVTPELAQEIQAVLSNGTQFKVYSVPRRNFIGQRWIRYGGWYPSGQVKLFQRSIFRWEETTVHPRAISNEPWGVLKGDLLHFSYRDIEDFVAKMNRQTALEAQKWIADGRRVTLGKALWRSLDRFVRTYVGKRGYRDGFWGFVVAVMAGMYQWIAWAKYTEYRRPVCVEEVVKPFGAVTRDQERYDRALLMSHLCAYRTAASHAAGRRVLEIGCGSGYGAYYLAHVAREVTAINVNREALDRAQALFRRANLTYVDMEGTRLDFPDGRFDVVGSFQVIEHIPEPSLRTFLTEIARVLAPGGVCVISTLNVDHNRKGAASYQKPSFHEKEFSPAELRTLLDGVFPFVELHGLYPTGRHRAYQRLKKWGVDRWGPARWNAVRRFYDQELNTDDYRLVARFDDGAIDLIAVCRTARDQAGEARLVEAAGTAPGGRGEVAASTQWIGGTGPRTLGAIRLS